MSDYEIDSATVETDAGTYTVRWFVDDTPEQPYDEGFVLAVDGSSDWAMRSRVDIEHGDVPDGVWPALQSWRYSDSRSGAALVRWLKILGYRGVTLVDADYHPVEPSSDRDERVHGVAIAPSDATNPDEYVRTALKEWRAWAVGDCFGWVVLAPNGETVESVWGYYGFHAEREYTLSEAKAAIEWHATERIEKSNLVGAGIVGII